MGNTKINNLKYFYRHTMQVQWIFPKDFSLFLNSVNVSLFFIEKGRLFHNQCFNLNFDYHKTFNKSFTILLLIQHMWKAAISDKLKVFASPANYLKRLFVDCTYLGLAILQKQFWTLYQLIFCQFCFDRENVGTSRLMQ